MAQRAAPKLTSRLRSHMTEGATLFRPTRRYGEGSLGDLQRLLPRVKSVDDGAQSAPYDKHPTDRVWGHLTNAPIQARPPASPVHGSIRR